MKTNFKLKFHQYFSQRKSKSSLTKLQLLGIAFIGGCATVIALPFLVISSNQTLSGCGKGTGYEARQYIGVMNRAQQAYFFEKNKFADSLQALDVGLKNQTSQYNYSIRKTDEYVLNYATVRPDIEKTQFFGPFKWPFKTSLSLKSYVGGVYWTIKKIDGKSEKITHTIQCETNSPSLSQAADPIYQNGVLTCDASQIDLGK